MRKTILSIAGSVLLLALAFFVFNRMANSKKAPQRNTEKTVQSVTVKPVQNSTLPIEINSTGALVAKERATLYAEVQGIFEETSKSYKEGVSYSRGQVLIRINNAEFAASVQSQRIAFKSLITATLADIQFDYSSELPAWKAYAASISAQRSLPKLPEVNNENLQNYLSVKNINSTFYTIKNLEMRLGKYTITAPFTGVLVEANVTPGTLVSPGQKLGEFVKPGVYELELTVNASLFTFLKVGKKVSLTTNNKSTQYQGQVSRINAQIDRASQTVQVFVQVSSNDLNEGEYLEAHIEAQMISDVMEIERNLILEQNYVFIVDNNILKKVPITIVHANSNTLIVKGLKENDQLVSMPVSGGYEGMTVTIRK